MVCAVALKCWGSATVVLFAVGPSAVLEMGAQAALGSGCQPSSSCPGHIQLTKIFARSPPPLRYHLSSHDAREGGEQHRAPPGATNAGHATPRRPRRGRAARHSANTAGTSAGEASPVAPFAAANTAGSNDRGPHRPRRSLGRAPARYCRSPRREHRWAQRSPAAPPKRRRATRHSANTARTSAGGASPVAPPRTPMVTTIAGRDECWLRRRPRRRRAARHSANTAGASAGEASSVAPPRAAPPKKDASGTPFREHRWVERGRGIVVRPAANAAEIVLSVQGRKETKTAAGGNR